MKYDNTPTEVAYQIAAHGKAEQEVGLRSEQEAGSMWQALVRLNRTNLIRAGLGDDRRLWAAIRPGHDALVWLVEDEAGHVICHRAVDCDAPGFRERIAEMTHEFETLTAFYHEGVAESVDYGEYVSTDNS